MFRNVYYIVFVSIFLTSCKFYTKKTYISKLDTFIIETNNNYKNYTNHDWNEADSLYNNLQADYKEIRSELTDDESTRINNLLGKYQAIKLKSEVINIKTDLNNMMQQANSFIKEITSDTTLTK
jgi:hypothetical protein